MKTKRNHVKGKNEIEELDENIFLHSKKLEKMLLDHNRLKLPEIGWQKNGHKIHLTLSDNPWNCECPMLLFVNAILNQGIMQGKQPRDAQPYVF